MIANKLLLLLTVTSLVAGCAVETSSPSEVEASPVPSPLPTRAQGLDLALTAETPEMPADRVTPNVPPQAEHQPPEGEDNSPLLPVRMARVDLSRRLRVDTVWIEVVEATIREPSAEDMPCLANDAIAEELGNLDQVEWVSLSYKDNVYHYIISKDLVIYCNE